MKRNSVKRKTAFTIALGSLLVVVPMILYAQVEEAATVPISDVFNDIAELVKNFKGLSGIGVSSALLAILLQFLKTDLAGGLLKNVNSNVIRIIVTVLGQVSGIIIGVAGGLGWLDSVIAGLLTSGGAVAIFEAVKPFFKGGKV